MSYMRRVARGTTVVFVMMLATALLGYLFRLVLAKKLSITEFGLFFAVFALVDMFYGFKSVGMGAAVVRQLTEHRIKNSQEGIKKVIIAFLLVQLVVFGVISLAILLLSGYLTTNYFKNPAAFWLLIVLVIAFFFSIFVTTFRSIFQGFQKMGRLSAVEFLQTLFVLIFSFVFLKLGMSVLAPAYAYLASFIIVAIWTFILTLKIFPLLKVKAWPDKKTFLQLIKFGLPVTLGMIGVSIIQEIDVIAITYFKTLADVALYSVAMPTANLLRYIPRALMIVLLPIASELHITKNKKFGWGISQLYKYMFIAMIPLAMVMFAFPELIITTLFGGKFAGAAVALRILAIGMVFTSVYMINQYILLGINRPKDYTKTVLVGAVASLVLNFILVAAFGILGAAFAVSSSSLLMLLQSSFQIKKHIKIKIPWWNWFKTLVAGFIFVAIVFGLKQILVMNRFVEAAICLAVAGIVYAGLLLIMKLASIQEIKNMITLSLKK